MVTKIDRLPRSTLHFWEIVWRLLARGVAFRGLNLGAEVVETSSATGRLTLAIFAGFAQFEREIIGRGAASGSSPWTTPQWQWSSAICASMPLKTVPWRSGRCARRGFMNRAPIGSQTPLSTRESHPTVRERGVKSDRGRCRCNRYRMRKFCGFSVHGYGLVTGTRVPEVEALAAGAHMAALMGGLFRRFGLSTSEHGAYAGIPTSYAWLAASSLK